MHTALTLSERNGGTKQNVTWSQPWLSFPPDPADKSNHWPVSCPRACRPAGPWCSARHQNVCKSWTGRRPAVPGDEKGGEITIPFAAAAPNKVKQPNFSILSRGLRWHWCPREKNVLRVVPFFVDICRIMGWTVIYILLCATVYL